MSDYREYILSALKANCISCTDKQAGLLSDYLSELLRVNEHMNLTAIRDKKEASVLNIADCAACARFIPENAALLDVGSGAGLPAFPFAILRPDIKVTALDSTGKKVSFISDTAKALGISNLEALCCRAEELASDKKYRENFNAVSARAVARLNILCELCIPFLKNGGIFISMKSRFADTELGEAKHAISLLGGKVKDISRTVLEGLPEKFERTAIIIEKVSKSPERYPRQYARISAKPL